MISVKPSRPVINWSNPITKGLVFDAPMTEGGGGAQDIVSKSVLTVGGAPTWAMEKGGRGVRFTGSDDDRYTYVTPSQMNSQSLISVETLSIMDASPGNGVRLFHKGVTGVHANRYYQHGEHDGGHMYFAGDWSSAQGAWRISAGVPAAGVVQHIVSTYDGRLTTNDPVVYQNGINMPLTEVVTPSGTRGSDTAVLYIGNANSGNSSWKGVIFYTRMWNRILTHNEVRQLYRDPWQIYIQPKFNSYDVAAVAASTYVNSFYGGGGYF